MALQCAKAFARDYGGAYEVNAQNILSSKRNKSTIVAL